MSTLSYRGYVATVEFDSEDMILTGRIAGINDVIGFHAESPAELVEAFHEAVDDYLETCAQIGKQPEKAYSGKVMFRVPPAHTPPMRTLLLTAALSTLLATPLAAAAPSLIGHYRLAGGPDVVGELEITADHHFRYGLAAGALDEQAEGRWVADGAKVCLYTDPRPVPPAFTLTPRAAPADKAPSLLVKWPNGRGVALVDFVIGFDRGEPLTGYTQDYGWTMPHGDRRVPRWIELTVPMHGIKSPRLSLDGKARGTINVLLTPNDLGMVDFQHVCLEAVDGGFVLHRDNGDWRFVRSAR